ncbi:MAG TPA: CpsD/CapB family tyrosine-protein kinase [Anaeromyxobacteraceae bacterium]|nr:CpsD/CapB family tyrosine-protein kinase [Anaeromyxobacteraceae bacterium]
MIPAETMQASFPSTSPEGRLVALDAPDSPAAAGYRLLLARLERIAAQRPLRVVAVTSSTRGEGRTTTAANLALTAARDGHSTVLVEADLRRPTLAKLLGLAPRAGLAEVLDGSAELTQAIVRVGPLAVLTAGDVRDAAAALRSPRIPAVVDALRAAHGYVILDAPPAIAFAEGDRLVGAADAAILVVRAGSTPREVVRLALDAIGERAVGIVLNGADASATVQGRWLASDAVAVPASR